MFLILIVITVKVQSRGQTLWRLDGPIRFYRLKLGGPIQEKKETAIFFPLLIVVGLRDRYRGIIYRVVIMIMHCQGEREWIRSSIDVMVSVRVMVKEYA
jgi:hypothetical protein